MLEDKIRQIAADEGWSDQTLISVLVSVLAEISRDYWPTTHPEILLKIEEQAHG